MIIFFDFLQGRIIDISECISRLWLAGRQPFTYLKAQGGRLRQ